MVSSQLAPYLQNNPIKLVVLYMHTQQGRSKVRILTPRMLVPTNTRLQITRNQDAFRGGSHFALYQHPSLNCFTVHAPMHQPLLHFLHSPLPPSFFCFSSSLLSIPSPPPPPSPFPHPLPPFLHSPPPPSFFCFFSTLLSIPSPPPPSLFPHPLPISSPSSQLKCW